MNRSRFSFKILFLIILIAFLFMACSTAESVLADEVGTASSEVDTEVLKWKENTGIDLRIEKLKSYYLSGLARIETYELTNVKAPFDALNRNPEGFEISIGAHIGISGKGKINNFSLVWVNETEDYITGFLAYDGSTAMNEGLTGNEAFISDNSGKWMTKIAFVKSGNKTRVLYATKWVRVTDSWNVAYENLLKQNLDFEAYFDANFSLEQDKNKHKFIFQPALIENYTSSTYKWNALGDKSYSIEINSRLYPSFTRYDFPKDYPELSVFESSIAEIETGGKKYVKDGSWYYDKGLNQCYKDTTNIYEYTPGIILFGYKEKSNTPEGVYYQTGLFVKTNGDALSFSNDGSTFTYKKGEESNTYNVVGQFTISLNKTSDLPLEQAYLLQKGSVFYGATVQWYTNNFDTYVNIREPKELADKDLFKPLDTNLDGSQGTADWNLFGSRVRTFNKQD